MRSHVDVFELCFIDALRISYDLENGGPQETIRFFAKARPCECLSDIMCLCHVVLNPDGKHDVISKEEPQFVCGKWPPRHSRCKNCGKIVRMKEVLLCGSCGLDQYCSVHCQKAMWPEHRNFCEQVQAMHLCYNSRRPQTRTWVQLMNDIHRLVRH